MQVSFHPVPRAAVILLAVACTTHAYGRQPKPYQVWMTFKVASCEPVTFTAPAGNDTYVPDASFTTAVVQGIVAAAGVDSFHPSFREEADLYASRLPAPGTSVDAAVVGTGRGPVGCDALSGKTQTFVIGDQGCDVLPRSGACLIRMQVLSPASPRPHGSAAAAEAAASR